MFAIREALHSCFDDGCISEESSLPALISIRVIARWGRLLDQADGRRAAITEEGKNKLLCVRR